MIITKTPYRISLFGGGTDFPPWYKEHGGAVLGFTIDKYCWVALRKLPPFFDHKYRIVWSRIELVNSFNEIANPIVKEVLSHEGIHTGVELHHEGDLPARSGLGASSSFCVGLLNAIRAFRGQRVSAKDLARMAIHIERDRVGDAGGVQDQIWAAYGGFRVIRMHRDDTFTLSPVVTTAEAKAELGRWMMLFFTGMARSAAEVEARKIANIRDRTSQLISIQAMVDEALDSIEDPRKIARLLDETWKMKRQLAPGVSTDDIDEMYRVAKNAGVVGGKVLGAGGGGFILLMAPPEKHAAVRSVLSRYIQVPFSVGSEGSRVVVYENGEDG
jgi:D-glycero-alpha-D-manno-heptose-7-phosphate kinase